MMAQPPPPPNTAQNTTKGKNEIQASGVQMHWPPQEKMDGNLRAEYA
jgi:hypothetical protein